MHFTPQGGVKFAFPPPEVVVENFDKWFPDLPDATRERVITSSPC